jgi:hypothetical protein
MILNPLNTLSYDKAIRIDHALYKTLRMARTGEVYDYMSDANLNQDDRGLMQQFAEKIRINAGYNDRIEDALKELNQITDKLMKASGADPLRGKKLLESWNS